jgi:hypothetical protein
MLGSLPDHTSVPELSCEHNKQENKQVIMERQGKRCRIHSLHSIVSTSRLQIATRCPPNHAPPWPAIHSPCTAPPLNRSSCAQSDEQRPQHFALRNAVQCDHAQPLGRTELDLVWHLKPWLHPNYPLHTHATEARTEYFF